MRDPGSARRAGIVLLNFGEPKAATVAEVVPFLERIFATNASLEGDATPEAVRERSRQLAERRAPGLIAEYEEIGGSPLNEQAAAQAEMLRDELARRGHDVLTYVAYQFTDPLIGDIVRQAREDGVTTLIGFAVYPLCGPSTNVAALETLEAEVADAAAETAAAADAADRSEGDGWDVRLHQVSGWHRHPDYVRLRADGVRDLATARGLDLADPRTRLVFSAHGTPMKYIREGSRYTKYVIEHCRAVAAELGVEAYTVGYQNHTNRDIDWTQPDIEDAIREVDADRVVVVPVSFMHEQSETLAELDHELREVAEAAGLEFHRVPVPHDDPRFGALMADLCEPLLRDDPAAAGLRACHCRPGAVCLNA